MANLGFIGLGAMGGHMADRLMSHGHTVTGYNRTRAKAQWLIDKGMKFGRYAARGGRSGGRDLLRWSPTRRRSNTSPKGPTECSPDSVREILIDMSTVSPAVSRALAAKVRDEGADMVDAPVSGSVDHAPAGQALGDGGRHARRHSNA